MMEAKNVDKTAACRAVVGSQLQQWTLKAAVLLYCLCAVVVPPLGPGGSVAEARASGFYADNGIDQTVMYEQVSRRERREMQREILTLLGLHHRPRPTPRGTENSAPKYMISLYRSFVDEAESGGQLRLLGASRPPHDGRDTAASWNLTGDSVHAINDADVIMSFVNHGHRLGHFRHEKDKRFWFDVSEVRAEETIMEAELRLYKEVPDSSSSSANAHDENNGNDQYKLSLFKIVQGLDPEDKELHFLDSVNVSMAHNGWIKLNVTGAASDWVVFPDKNLGLYLRIQADKHARELHPKEVGIVGNKGRADRQPFMVAFFKTAQELHVRRTRAAQRKQSMADTSYSGNAYGLNSYMHFDPNYMRRSCQTRTLYVNFKDLGWQDWIIAPDGYAAFYCQGECSFPLNTNMNATNHAIVQTLVNLMKPETVPKPCCAPSKLSHISVLYYDDNSNVILKKYRNMVVRACGCH